MRKELLTYTALGTSTVLAVWTGQAAAQTAGFDWSGFYVGGTAGADMPSGVPGFNFPEGVSGTNNVYFAGNAAYFSTEPVLGTTVPWPTELGEREDGFAYSAGGGYNFHQGHTVFGIEADYTWFERAAFSGSAGDNVADGRTDSISISGSLDQMISIRPRFGIAVDRLLLFGTGGLAAGQATIQTVASLDQGYGTADWQGRKEAWQLGFVVGGGAEYALTDHLSIKVEGLYYDLGTLSAESEGTGTSFSTPLSVSPYEASVDLSGVIVRGGINLHF